MPPSRKSPANPRPRQGSGFAEAFTDHTPGGPRGWVPPARVWATLAGATALVAVTAMGISWLPGYVAHAYQESVGPEPPAAAALPGPGTPPATLRITPSAEVTVPPPVVATSDPRFPVLPSFDPPPPTVTLTAGPPTPRLRRTTTPTPRPTATVTIVRTTSPSLRATPKSAVRDDAKPAPTKSATVRPTVGPTPASKPTTTPKPQVTKTTTPPSAATDDTTRGGGTSGSGAGVAVRGHASGKCIDASAGTLQIRACNGSGSQKWEVNADRTVRALGQCMEVAGGSSANGASIQLAPCDGGAGQRFDLNSAHDLVYLAARRCVDVTDKATGDGARLQLWTCNGGSHQKWSQG